MSKFTRGRTAQRCTRYGARRPLPGWAQPLPVFQIDEHGRYERVADLSLTYPHGSVLEWSGDCPWPLDEDEREGLFEGLPYFLQDLRPEGFLGRAFARAYACLLQLPEDPTEWSDEDVLRAITRFGADSVGNHIIGSGALELYLKELQNPRETFHEAHLPDAYVQLADESMALGIHGSLAAGEFPKLSVSSEAGGACVKVLMKFSGSDDTPSSQRWADLLICEHLAARTLREVMGRRAAQ